MDHLCLSGLSQGVWCATVTRRVIPASGDPLFSGQTRRADELRFQQGSALRYVSVNGQTAVNETGLYIKMCLEGYGLAQLAENVIAEHLAQGTLVEIMADWQPPPVPVTLLYPHQRFLSPPYAPLLTG